MIGTDGKVLFENKFDSDKAPSYVVNGIFRILDNDTNQFVYYSATPTPKPIGNPKGYERGGICSEGIIPVVSSGERIHYITKTGETAFYLLPYQEKEFFCVCPFFTEHRAWFRLENRKCGYIDPQGNVVIEPIYDNAFPFHEGKAIVYSKERDKWIAIDVDGKELFEAASNGQQQYSSTFYNDGYCLIENFLLDANGKKIQRFPTGICYISPFIKGTALYQNNETGFWGQINVNGENVIEPKYSYALGTFGDYMYLGDTITKWKDDKGNRYMNVYAIDSNGKIQKTIENVSCFHPLLKSIVMAENEKYYFADKNAIPINNNLYYNISVPSHTGAPSPSYLWTFLIAPRSSADFHYWEVVTDYVDEEKTLASIFDKLTSEGVGKIKMGQTFSQLADLYHLYNDSNYRNIKSYADWLVLRTKDYGINDVYATYAVCGIFNWSVRMISMQIEIPYHSMSERIAQKISSYLTEVLGMTKIKYDDEGCHLYRSGKYSYDILYRDGEIGWILITKEVTGRIIK